MTQSVTTLAAKSRESVGKGTARAVRRNNEVPAVIYGDKKARSPSASTPIFWRVM
jgi:large subunit ribosomal protein L25